MLISFSIIKESGINAEKKTISDKYYESTMIMTNTISRKHGDTKSILFSTTSLDTDSNGNIYIFDSIGYKIVKFDKNCRYVKSWGKEGFGHGEFYFPRGISSPKLVVSPGNRIYVSNNRKIQIFNSNGKYLNEFKYYSITLFNIDAEGNIIQNILLNQNNRFRSKKNENLSK